MEGDSEAGSPPLQSSVPPVSTAASSEYIIELRGLVHDEQGTHGVVRAMDLGLRVRQLAEAQNRKLTPEEVRWICARIALARQIADIRWATWPAEGRWVRTVRRVVQRLTGSDRPLG